MRRALRLPRQQQLVLRPLLWLAPSVPAASRRRRKPLQLQPQTQARLLAFCTGMQQCCMLPGLVPTCPMLIVVPAQCSFAWNENNCTI